KPLYVYSGEKYRDPFVQAGASANYQADAVFDPTKAQVKGIIFGPSFRSAVLAVGTNVSYYVKSGRIFDVMGKMVDGFSAKVYEDKVVLMGEADNVIELKIKNEDNEKPGKGEEKTL